MNRFAFPKEEKIVSQKLIDELFDKTGSQSMVAFPVRMVWREAEKTQVLVSVSKRRFKHAIDRNRVKRQLREAYRLNKHLLDGRSLAIAFLWLTDSHLPSALVQKRMVSLLKRLSQVKANAASCTLKSEP